MTNFQTTISSAIDLSILVPVLNEEEAIPIFIGKIAEVLAPLGLATEIIFVDDGSTDRTAEVVATAHAADPGIKLVRLSRNFGKEAALVAGLEASSGAAVVPIDVDLQDPPELIADFVRLWRDGYDVVYGKRERRDDDSRAKRQTAGLFYMVFNKLSTVKMESDVGDFRLMNRRTVNAILALPERNRFMRALVTWVGFRSTSVPYARPVRSAGTTKYNYWKMWNLALDGLTSFSTIPLRVWTYIGGLIAVAAILYTLVTVAQTLLFGREVPGYASLMVVMLLLGAVQLISLGVIGEYLGRLYIEAKQRPIYLAKDYLGFEATAAASSTPEIRHEPRPDRVPAT